MTTLYPGALDNFENPTGSESMAGKENGVVVHPGVLHSKQHSNTNDAIEAIQSYVGISGSVDLNSITYKISSLSTTFGTFVTQTQLTVAINDLINAAPGALNTLEELADALGDDPNFATTVTNSLALKAPLASPIFTGVPAGPTASQGTNTTQLATTAMVHSEVSLLAPATLQLKATSVKTTSYNAVPGDYIPVDTTSGVIVITLPNAPADGSIVAVKRIVGATNAVTVNAAGSDVFNVTAGSVTASVAILNQQLIFRYKSAGAIWYLETSLSLGGLDGRYAPLVHAANHASGGSDPITIAESQVTNLTSDLVLKAALASPALTGNPTAPTQAANDNSTKIATTAYIDTSLGLKANLISPTFTGIPAAPTAAQGTNTTQLATTGMVHSETVLLATLISPALSGNPTAPTQTAGNNSTRIATTAYVDTGLTLKADLVSPTFTGTPAAPTAAQGANTTQLATTAMVHSETILLATLASPTFTGTPQSPVWKSTGTTGANNGSVVLTGSNASGSPSSGAHLKGEVAGDDTGKLWYCTVAGTPGTWINTGGSAVVTDGDYGDIVISSGVWSFDSAVVTATARTLLDDTTISAMRTTLGVAIGSNVQAWDATLDALAAADWVANALPIGTGANTLSQTSFAANTFPARSSSGNLVAKVITDFGLSLIDDADATTSRTTLGLGTAAVADTGTGSTNVPTITQADIRYAPLASQLKATAVKTANYSAVAGDLIPVDTTSGVIVIILPTAPADGTVIAIKRVIGATNAVTINAGGSDVFNVSGGVTSASLAILNQEFIFRYKATGAIWYTTSALSLSSLDSRYQALDTTLTNLAAVNWSTDSLPIGSGADTVAQVTFSANTFPAKSSSGNLVAKTITDFGLSLIDDAASSNARTTLGLVIGTDVEAHDADLTAIAALTSAADKLPYATGAQTWALADFTSTARTLLDDTSTSAMRTTLGLGTAAIVDTGTSGANIPTITQADARYAPFTPTVGSSLATTGTINLDFSTLDGTYQSQGSLTGAITYTTSNLTAGRTVTLKIANGGTLRAFTFPAWIFVGAAAPASIAASKTAILTITSFSTTDANCIAAYSVQP